MATRRQQAAPSRQPAAPRAQGVDQLPDDLLTRILGGLSLRERQVATLVSRRWHRCAHAPELCREVEVKPSLSYVDYQPVADGQDLPSVAAWLRRHGRHVRRLRLEVFSSYYGPLSLGVFSSYHLDDVRQQLAQCMSAAASTMPQLEALLVSWNDSYLEVSWAEQLPPSLRELVLHQGTGACKIHLCSSLAGLTQLTKLMFRTDLAVVDPDVQLPPSIRTLAFNGCTGHGLPPQLSTLTSVDTLAFQRDVDGFDGLEACATQMTRLTFLQLEGALYFPPCIGSLTSLQHLAVTVYNDAPKDGYLDGVAPALQRLTGLTSLLLAADYRVQGSPPPTLAGLSRLQRLCFLVQDGPLPLGPYSAGLRVLGASAKCLESSTALLAACSSLEHAAVLRGKCDAPGPLWQWAALHPPLRRLQVVKEPWHLAGLREVRPQLEVECIDAKSFLALLMWQDPVWNSLERI